MTSEIERDFYKDCADKKRTAYGIHKKNRTGKGVVRLPSDYLPRKELKELMNTEVVTEDLSLPISYQSFKKLSPKNKKLQLEIWGNVYGYSSTVIAKILGISHAMGYIVVKEAGLTESFKEKGNELKKDKSKEAMEKKRSQQLRLHEILGNGEEPVENAEDETFEAPPATDIPEDEPVVEKPVEPLVEPLTVIEEKTEVVKKPIESFSTNISGRGDVIGAVIRAQIEAMKTCLDQIEEDAVYNVQMTFFKL